MDCITSTNHRPPPAAIASFSPEFPYKSWKPKTASKLSLSTSMKFLLHTPSPIYFPISSPSRFTISAHSHRGSNRRNYLRKKLTQHKEVSLDSSFQNPIQKCVDNDASDSNLHSVSEKRRNLDASSSVFNYVGNSACVKETELVSKPKLLGGTVLFNKLENWVEQYKKDVEFWGMGTGAIFTVFKDSEGKVERVVVSVDEIMRRSGVEPLLYKDENVADSPEVSERISYAKSLAREIENGNDSLPTNSSLVKFVASKGKSGLLTMIQGVDLQPVLHSKLSRFGLIMVCGVFVVLAVKLFFTVGESKQEYTRLEKEMMRRK